jgi:hypothetical protein
MPFRDVSALVQDASTNAAPSSPRRLLFRSVCAGPAEIAGPLRLDGADDSDSSSGGSGSDGGFSDSDDDDDDSDDDEDNGDGNPGLSLPLPPGVEVVELAGAYCTLDLGHGGGVVPSSFIR